MTDDKCIEGFNRNKTAYEIYLSLYSSRRCKP